MAKGTKKYYVVWSGLNPGVYDTWAECLLQVNGVPNAKYKSFPSRELAEEAFNSSYYDYIGIKKASDTKAFSIANPTIPYPAEEALAVDAACSGNPGKMEYRGVYVQAKQQVFISNVFDDATNNVGEFLALVHGLSLLKKYNSPLPLYSDSRNAIAWVKAGKCRTKLTRTAKNEQVFALIARAEKWLADNQPITTEIRKWETSAWGEIPADFGRK